MYSDKARTAFAGTLEEISTAGLSKDERVILGPQGPTILVAAPGVPEGVEVLNFCANNYLGLSSHPKLIEAAHAALETHGFGLSSVRFICGTQDLHKTLEGRLADFVGQDDAILYSSCFDANGGLFETLLGEDDAVISDALNHASIIDGIRLCKATRLRYASANMEELEAHLVASQDRRLRLIATDGVFSMDGHVAPLDRICDLAEKYDALVMVDDSHATGFMGKTGRGTPEHHGVTDRVDIVTSTLGKALGGAAGGFVAARAEIVALLRQRSRPYLFSNTVAPSIVAATIAALDVLEGSTALRDHLMLNAARFRSQMTALGFHLKPGEHPIVPVMLGDAKLAKELATAMLVEGIYVIGFSFPVVPKGQARIRVQLSAAHSAEQVDRAVEAFAKVGKRLGVLQG